MSNFDEFKRLIRQRYGEKVVLVMINGLYAGETGTGGFFGRLRDTKLQYIYYHASAAIPNITGYNPLHIRGRKINEMDQVDERTFGILKHSLQAVPLESGDALTEDRIDVRKDSIEFNLISHSLRALSKIDMDKASKNCDADVGRDNRIKQTITIPNLGMRFKFVFNKELLGAGEYRTVIAEINKYLQVRD